MKRIILLLLITHSICFSQFGSQDSGGFLIKEQSCFDVTYYDLALNIDPSVKAISGKLIMKAFATEDFSSFVLNLDTTMTVYSIDYIEPNSVSRLTFLHSNGLINIDIPAKIKKGNIFSISIEYGEMPRIAKRAPWDDGFIWTKTSDGIDWITLTCQGGGADIWFPCKDHPSDEPDSVSLSFTFPKNLKCIASGKLISEHINNDNTQTSKWFVSTPINNYNIMFYLGPYKSIAYDYTSIAGEKIPFTIWVLPENFEKAKTHSPQFLTHMKINEDLCGPYPFRADKYAVVETPHLGMEHQTATAYGFGWKDDKDFPIDWLHHHEFSHEWWGNLVTAKDWSDFWIHEGIGLYMQPLYLEKIYGREHYIGYLRKYKKIQNLKPVAPRGQITASEAYQPDIYNKGAWIVHTLRNYIGDESFFKLLRRWAYPTEELEKTTNGEQCRLVTTDEFLKMAEDISGKKLDWFWEVYLRSTKLPKLIVSKSKNLVELKWETEKNIPFFLSVPIKLANKILLVDMRKGTNSTVIPEESELLIDPEESILMEIEYNKLD
jgi:aminopeptidase N